MKNIICFIIMLVLAGCAGNTKDKNASSNNSALLLNSSKVVFEGTLPCADCKGIKTTLTLFQGKTKNQNTYKLQEVYIGQGNEKAFETYGKWTALFGSQQYPKAIVYQLEVQNDDPEDSDVINYLVVDNNTLKQIDEEMNEYESKLNYTLIKKQ